MNITIALISLSIVIVGLKLTDVEKGTLQEMADDPNQMCPWTSSARLKVLYGTLSILSVIFVIALMIYLSITWHWWFFLLYFPALFIGSMIAMFLKLLLAPFVRGRVRFYSLMPDLFVCRLCGLALMCLGLILFVFGLF